MFDIDNLDKPVDLTEGSWVDDIPDHPEVSFKVRSRNYKPFRQAVQRLNRSYGKKIEGALNSPESQAALGKLLAEHILLDWKNAVKQDGESAKYSKTLAEKILTSTDDRGMGQNFRDVTAYAAQVVADRHLGLVEDITGN